ncbi:MAG TPA: hypothetical protein VJU81_24670 [Methylomirabilota bacterium]|nr:hypothetical protein [Methylomirabilota bacterium]
MMGSSGLLSATFHEPGHRHLLELVHQRDLDARRHLDSLELTAYDAAGTLRRTAAVDTRRGVVDLAELLGPPARERLLVLLDARYDPAIFPYRPHHYAYLHRRGSPRPPLYYAVNATLGGVPDRIGASRFNHFETYLFLRRGVAPRAALLLGNPSRFATARAEVTIHYDAGRVERTVELPPKSHAEVALPPAEDGGRVGRVELKAPFRLTSYVTGRDAGTGDLVLFDHLFTYFR